jgi:ABC-2 type transport system ATP-binding protein
MSSRSADEAALPSVEAADQPFERSDAASTVANSDLAPSSEPTPSSSAPGTPLAIHVEGLQISYGRFCAVKGLTLKIPKGEVFGFIGPNGAGKSSTMRVLATLQSNYVGRASVLGYDVRRESHKVRENIGYVPDFFGVYEDLSVREYLHFFAAAYQLPWHRRPATVDDVLQLTDLTHKIDSSVDALSRGMKQRLSLARVLLHDPAVLLLDEPASGLDPRARIEMRELLKALKEMGKTILISSHILHELAQLCTQIGILEAGRLVIHGSVDEIYRRLGLMRIVHLQLVNRPPNLLESLRGIPGVARVDAGPDRWSIHLEESALPIEDLHDFCVQQGARIRMFQAEVMDMETAFMKLTEGQTQ